MNDFRRILIELDVAGARALWAKTAPKATQPASDGEALATLHMARTAAVTVPFKARAYSHCWLLDHGFPSQLPDRLKPRAERLYPREVRAVGIAVHATNELFKPIVPLVRGAMEDAVLECFADGHERNSELVRARMIEAKRTAVRKLIGIR